MTDTELPIKIDSSYDLPSERELFKRLTLTNDIVWNNKLSKIDVENWLSNFKGEVFDIPYERQLALWLLVNFVYYNENEVRHLCKTLYRDFIHRMLIEKNETKESDIEKAFESIFHVSRFFNLGMPGESGAYILYYFRQENKLPLQSFISHPAKLPSFVDIIVFVDDVTLSGTQANKYLRDTMDYFKDKTKILLTFISTDEAVQLLRKSDIHVLSCITLDNRSKCFSENSSLFHDCRSKIEDCRKFAMVYGRKSLQFHPVSLHPLGYMGGEYAFGFFYNTPDNTLPIFWADNQGWSPIMRRYEKYIKRTYDGRFV